MKSARSGSPEEGTGRGGCGVSAPVSSCMHEEQKTERKKRWQAPDNLPRANGTGRSSPNAFSLKITGLLLFLLCFFILLDANLIFRGEGEWNH